MNETCMPSEILKFWFSEKVKSLWFKKSAAFDREIEARFIKTYLLAKTGSLDHWKNNPHNTLALIILLDQFPRNMFRDTPQAFATDNQAVELTKYALDHNYDQNLSLDEKVFFYMPLMHSESKADQDKSVELFSQLGKKDSLKFAIKHQEIINHFGRFPHRNKILNRESTLEEKEFLTQPGSSF